MAPPLSAALPLLSYAEPLCAQARVLVVGNATSELAPLIIERGARLVHVCDSDAGRRAEAQARSSDRNVSFGSLGDGPAALREGFFDLVLFENLAAEREPASALGIVAKLLTRRGAALIMVPNPEALSPLLGATGSTSSRPIDYYALYDLAVASWPKVRMLGQVPFVGYAVVDFSAEGDPNPVLDTSLAPARGEEPDYFLAFAGRELTALEQFTVVQLPATELLSPRSAQAAAVVAAAVAPTPVPAAPPVPVLAAPAPVPAVKERPVAPAVTTTPTPAPAAKAEPSVTRGLEQKLLRQEAWIAELEARASTADERADAAESELDDVRERLGELEKLRTEERSALSHERDTLKVELDRLRQRVNDLDDLVAQKDAELLARADDGETQLELDRLESQLRERGERVLTLEREVAETERIGRELLRKLEWGGSSQSAQQLAEQLASAQAELVTLRWSLELAKEPLFGAKKPSVHQ